MIQTLSRHRFVFITFLIFLGFILIIYQLFQLMHVHRDVHLDIADKQHHLQVTIPPERGKITDRKGKELVLNLKVPSIYAVPRMIAKDAVQATAERIHELLDLDFKWVQDRLKRDKAFVWLKRRASFEEADEIKALENPAFGFLHEYKRYYSQGTMLSHILGFTNIDNEGLEGLEFVMDSVLSGAPGKRVTRRDALGREIKMFEEKMLPALHGKTVSLTIDHRIQHFTEKALDHAYTKWKALAGWAIVMNPHTGEIVAMASRPHYDPNQPGQAKAEVRRNRAITDMYEPGSIFKVIPVSAALDLDRITPDTMIDTGNGKLRYGSRILHDVRAYGEISAREVVVKSSNIGTVKIADRLQPEEFQSYIEGFGLGAKTGIDLPGEARGYTNPPRKWSKTSPYNIPMGHEILVTALQMVRAMAVIANGGKLVQPYIISKIVDDKGVVIEEKQPQILTEQVIKPETAKVMRGILSDVVVRGTGRNARIEGISTAGKTGTAQKVLPNGRGYSQDTFMSSFLGFAPVEDPKYVMIVVMDETKPKYYGGTVAAPVFREVMEAALTLEGYEPPPPAEETVSDEEVKDIVVSATV